MSVLLREHAIIWGEKKEVKVFHPPGSLSRDNKERAEKLDSFLAHEAPIMAKRVMRIPKKKTLKKWYQFGKELHRILDGNDLVSRYDLENGLIWAAIKQQLPESIGIKGAGEVRDAEVKLEGQRGHLLECYAIAKHAWEDVQWMKRWTDWTDFRNRGDMCRDPRVLQLLHKEIEKMGEYPKRTVFRNIIKLLLTQTAGKDVEVLDDSVVAEKVRQVFNEIHFTA